MNQEEEMKILMFGEGLLESTLSGKKQNTLRKYRPAAHTFRENEEFIGRFEDGFDLLLRTTAATIIKTFAELTDEEARANGFSSRETAFEGMKEYYPGLSKTDQLAIIYFQVVLERDKKPKYMQPNEFAKKSR